MIDFGHNRYHTEIKRLFDWRRQIFVELARKSTRVRNDSILRNCNLPAEAGSEVMSQIEGILVFVYVTIVKSLFWEVGCKLT